MALSKCPPIVYDFEKDFLKASKLEQVSIIKTDKTGFISVVEAKHISSARQYAVKKLSLLTPDGHVKLREQFESEAVTLQNIRHPNLIKHVCSARSPLYLVICTDFYPNGTLLNKLASMTTDLCCEYFVQLACAVRYLNHCKQIIHCNIEAENVFIDGNNRPVLGNFGFSRSISGESQVTFGGTYGYRAPEVCDPTVTKVDPLKVDVYSLGVLLWSMVFKSAPKKDTAYRYLHLLKSNTEVIPPLRWCMERMLNSDPELRPNIKQLVDSLYQRRFHQELIDSLLEFEKAETPKNLRDSNSRRSGRKETMSKKRKMKEDQENSGWRQQKRRRKD